jgi:hypothetical protein
VLGGLYGGAAATAVRARALARAALPLPPEAVGD